MNTKGSDEKRLTRRSSRSLCSLGRFALRTCCACRRHPCAAGAPRKAPLNWALGDRMKNPRRISKCPACEMHISALEKIDLFKAKWSCTNCASELEYPRRFHVIGGVLGYLIFSVLMSRTEIGMPISLILVFAAALAYYAYFVPVQLVGSEKRGLKEKNLKPLKWYQAPALYLLGGMLLLIWLSGRLTSG